LNPSTQLLALDLIDFLVDKGKMPFHTQIGSIDNLSTLINLLKTRENEEVFFK
jgi:hypothetical protein